MVATIFIMSASRRWWRQRLTLTINFFCHLNCGHRCRPAQFHGLLLMSMSFDRDWALIHLCDVAIIYSTYSWDVLMIWAKSVINVLVTADLLVLSYFFEFLDVLLSFETIYWNVSFEDWPIQWDAGLNIVYWVVVAKLLLDRMFAWH